MIYLSASMPQYQDILLEKLKHLKNIADAHQIHLIYLVPNLSLNESSDWKRHLIHPLQNNSNLQIIDMAKPHVYLKLFDSALYHDKVHLHDEGADLYTQLLAEAYIKLED